jgi:hypothetical protein
MTGIKEYQGKWRNQVHQMIDWKLPKEHSATNLKEWRIWEEHKRDGLKCLPNLRIDSMGLHLMRRRSFSIRSNEWG